MRDGIGVPTLSEHGDGNDAPDRSAQLAMLPNGIHHLAEKRHVVEFLPSLKLIGELAAAFDNLAAEALYFVARHAAEVVIQRFAGFELLAVDKQRIWARERVAVLVEVAEERETSVFQCRRAI